MSMYLLSEIINKENREIILEAIDYANEQWRKILENKSYSEIKHLERELEQRTHEITMGKELIFYTGVIQFYKDGFSECDKEEFRRVLYSMKGISSEIDSMIREFKKDYNI